MRPLPSVATRQAAEHEAAMERRDRLAIGQENDRLRAKLRALGLDPDT